MANQKEQVIDDRKEHGGQLTIANIIEKKSKGEKLSADEIALFVKCVVEGKITEAQIGATLMAIFIHKLNEEETVNLTNEMIRRGKRIEWPINKENPVIYVDKHSTGGVGDKVSLVLTPLLAAYAPEVKVPMISGRSLAHTGGTLDKLESIPGFRTNLTLDEMKQLLNTVGCFIVGQQGTVPADEILYDRRNATVTIDEDGLITGSIISKKAIESLDALVLDVKFGSGAFCQDEPRAERLARTMVNVANNLQPALPTIALITDMNNTLGYMVGNSLEVKETIDCLHGEGPTDLTDLVCKLGAHLLHKAYQVRGQAQDIASYEKSLREILRNGKGLIKFGEMMKAQGVSCETADKLCDRSIDPLDILPRAASRTPLTANQSGYIHSIDALTCGQVSQELGGNRINAGDIIDYGVGLELKVQVGAKVEKDEKWVIVHHRKDDGPEMFAARLQNAIQIRDSPCESPQRVVKIIE